MARARASKPRRPKPIAAPAQVAPVEPVDPGPPPAMPEWWEPPSADVVAACKSEWTRGPQAETWGSGQMVERLRAGCYALPPWQRGDVWTHAQRVAMLQTMMDGLPLPPVILWKPPRRDDVEHMPIADCPTSQGWGTTLVIDGRQRLTTLVLAASGALDVRWNGREWTSGRGFVDAPAMLLAASTSPLALDACRNGLTTDQAVPIVVARDRLHFYRLTAIVFDGYTLDEMVEAYRRLVTCGTPHSETDLEAMIEWRARNQARQAAVDGA